MPQTIASAPSSSYTIPSISEPLAAVYFVVVLLHLFKYKLKCNISKKNTHGNVLTIYEYTNGNMSYYKPFLTRAKYFEKREKYL